MRPSPDAHPCTQAGHHADLWAMVRYRGHGLSRAAPLAAHPWSPGPTRRSRGLAPPRLGPRHHDAMAGLAATQRPSGPAHHTPHVAQASAPWAPEGSLAQAFRARVAPRAAEPPLHCWRRHGDGPPRRGPPGGDGMGDAGDAPSPGPGPCGPDPQPPRDPPAPHASHARSPTRGACPPPGLRRPCRADRCVGGHLHAAVASCRTDPAAALGDDGVRVGGEPPASVLRRLILATNDFI